MNRRRGVVEEHVEPRDGLDLQPVVPDEVPGLDRQERRDRVRRRERRLVQRDVREEVRRVAPEPERPRHAQRLQAAGDGGSAIAPVTIRSRGAAGARTVTCTLRERPTAEQEVTGH